MSGTEAVSDRMEGTGMPEYNVAEEAEVARLFDVILNPLWDEAQFFRQEDIDRIMGEAERLCGVLRAEKLQQDDAQVRIQLAEIYGWRMSTEGRIGDGR